MCSQLCHLFYFLVGPMEAGMVLMLVTSTLLVPSRDDTYANGGMDIQ